MRRPKKLDPKTQWIVADSNQPVAPAFYHEELANIIVLENAYAASARLTSVISDMLDILIELG